MIKYKIYIFGVDMKNNLECDQQLYSQKRQGTPKRAKASKVMTWGPEDNNEAEKTCGTPAFDL